MKILYFSQLYMPYVYGGGEYIFSEWGKELSKRRHKIITITQNINGIKNYDEIDEIKIYRVGKSIDSRGRLPPSVLDNLSYLLLSIIKGIQIIRKSKVDIIHSNSYTPILSGYICSKIFKIPHIVTFHDLYIDKKKFWYNWSKQEGISKTTKIIAPLFERFLLYLNNDIIHTVSKTSKNDINKYNKSLQTIIISNGINIKKYEIKKDIQSENYALYIGRLIFYKNVDTIIKAFNYLKEKKLNYKLYIIGEGPYKGNLVKIANNNENIIFMNRVTEELKIKMLNNSKFLVLPSIVEGFGIVILESYACKNPVIVSDVEPLSEIVINGETGFLVSPFDYQVWAKKIIYLFNNEVERKRLGKNGYKLLIENFTIKKTVDKLESLYIYIISKYKQ